MNTALLKGKIRERDYTQADVAKEIGISLSRFNAKINGTDGAEFSLGEVLAMKKVLCLDAELIDEIFFATKVS